ASSSEVAAGSVLTSKYEVPRGIWTSVETSVVPLRSKGSSLSLSASLSVCSRPGGVAPNVSRTTAASRAVNWISPTPEGESTGSAGVEHGALGLVGGRPEVRVVHHGSPVERLPDDVIVRDAQRILGDDAWGRALERRVFLWQRMGQIVRLRGGDRQFEKGHEHCESDDCHCGGLQPLPPAASFDPPVDRLQP